MAKISLPRWLQLFVRSKPKTIARSLRRRLNLESLEDRITPSKTLIWDGGGTTNSWSDPLNWNDNVSIPSIGDDLVFQNGAQRLSNNNDISNLVINSLQFSGNGYTLGGAALTLGSSGSGTGFIIANSGSSNNNNTVTFDITLGGTAGDRQFFTVEGASLRITGALHGSTGVELSKDGPGTLILAADNSFFTGPISIVEGPLKIQNANALGDTSNPTTVVYDSFTNKFGQLQVENITGTINEALKLNGPGPQNDGALLNVAGTNFWAGPIELDSNATIGSAAGSLVINGIVSDLGAGHDLTKEGNGQVVLDPINAAGTLPNDTGNTYRGETFVNAGILTIRHSYALGNPTTTPTATLGVNNTVVQSSTNRSGTLQLEFLSPTQRQAQNLPLNNDPNVNATNDGFTVPNELLTLNGPGFEGIHTLPKAANGNTEHGALHNLAGTNTWVQNISLWSGDTAVVGDPTIWSFGSVLPVVGIGAEAGATLIITGRINDTNLAGTPALTTKQYSLAKMRPGRVVFVHDNSYRGKTEILQGYLNIRDSFALGTATLGNANNGTFVFPGGTLELEADEIPDSTAPFTDPPHALDHIDTDLVITNENLRPMGNGANGDGAIRNIRGVNEITGNLQLQCVLPRGGIQFNGTGASFGVLPDYNIPNNYATLTAPFDDPLYYRSQLTLSGIVGDDSQAPPSNLTKFGQGELVLTNANTYTGRTFISEGWVTARNGRALGADFPSQPDTLQPETYIAPGAMLALKQTRTASPLDISVTERIYVSGDGIDHLAEPILYPSASGLELNHNGAILNLSGNNSITGIVTLVAAPGADQIGIGADIDSTDTTVTQSSLNFTNLMRDDVVNAVAPYPYAVSTQPAPAGINKLGTKRVILQGHGTFTGDNTVSEGVLRIQSDTALGSVAGTTTVADGAALETAGYATTLVLPPTALDQFASSVIAFGSEWQGVGWHATEALGAPDTFGYGDIPTAWSADLTDGPPNPDFITVGYVTPVFATGVTVRETNDNGFVTMIELQDTSNVFHTVFTGPDTSPQGIAFDFTVNFPMTNYLVKAVRVTTDPNTVIGDWEEIDAITLHGVTGTGPVTTVVNTFNGGLTGGIQVFENLILNGIGNFTADDPTHFFLTPTQVDTLTNIDNDNNWRTPITFASDVTIDSRADSRISLWKPIDGSGGFTKDGVGKLVLGGVNTYAGDTVINAGIVNLQSSSALGGPNVSETQTVTILNSVGTFRLSFNGVNFTNPLPFNASQGAVQNELNNLLPPGSSVSVSLTNNVYQITFGGSLANTNQAQIQANGSAGPIVATLQNGGGGTVVKNDAQIELQGDITIGGESLSILGNGPNSTPSIPLRWYQEGPGPINEPLWSGNSTTGRVTGVTTDPNDPNILYLSSAGGGAWRSLNGGLTWQPLIDNVPGLAINQVLFTGGIAVAPTDSNTIYVALGESNESADSFYGRGILKSSDFGRTWTLIQGPGNAFDKHTFSKIVVDPTEADTIYVAVFGNGVNEGLGGFSAPANYGIWRLRGGWVNLTAGVINPIAFDTAFDDYTDLVVINANPRITVADIVHPNLPNRRIVAFTIGLSGGSTDNDVYISLDCDTNNNAPTWISAPSLPVTESGFPTRNGFMKLTGVRNINSRDTITLMAAINYPEDIPRAIQGVAGELRDIWSGTITFAGGSTWIANNWAALGTQPVRGTVGFFPATQGFYDLVIGMKSQTVVGTPAGTTVLGDPNFVFLAGIGSVFTPGPFIWNGNAWNDVDPGVDGKGPHVDYHAYSYDRTGRLLVGNDGGIWRMENLAAPTPNAAQWTNLNQLDNSLPSFLQITELNGVDVHPFNPFFAIGGAQDNGTEVYNDNLVWTVTDGGDGGLVQINNQDPTIVFKTTNGQLYRSTQSGASGSWVSVLNVGPLYFPILVDRTNPSRVLVGSGSNLLESMSNGAAGTFQTIGSGASQPNGLGSMGGGTFSFSNQIAVADRQGPWVLDPGFPLVVDQGAEAYDSDTIYALTTGNNRGVIVTKNHGQAWVRRDGTGANSLPTSLGDYSDYSQIVVDPRNRDVAYVTRAVFNGAPGQHVFTTTDAGQNWIDISGNLPDVPVWSVAVNSRTGDVYVGTDSGLFYLAGGQGTTWQRFGVGLPNVLVSGVVFNPLTNMLTVSTYGRGMFQLWLDESKSNSGAVRAVTGSSVWTGPVTITGGVDLRADADAQINFVGQIADDSAGANHLINKVGQGRVVFSGANSYGGVTDVKEGELAVRNASALGSSTSPAGNTIVETGAALELQSDLAKETVVLNGNGIVFNGHNTGALRSVSNNNTFTGTLQLNTNSTIGVDSGSQLTIGTKAGLAGVGTIADGGSNRNVTKELTGTLVLNSANTYGGTTDVVQGILQVAHGQALGGTTAGSQVRNGAQMQLANNITVAGETLTLSGTGIFSTGALENLSGNNTWQGPVVFTGLLGVAAPPPPVPSSTINIGVLNAGETLTIDGTISQQTITIPAQPPGIPNPVTLNSFGLTKVLPGKLVLKGNADNTYTGVTTVQQGVLNIQKAQALGTPGGPSDTPANGTVVVAGAALETEGNISFAAETVTLNGTGVSPTALGALRNTGGSNTWTGPVILNSTVAALGGAANPAINIGADASTQLTITGVVQDVSTVPASNKAAALHKVGDGTIVLPNANTYIGRTFVDKGILNVRNDASLGTGGSATNDTTVASGATLEVQGGFTETNELLSIIGLGANGEGALTNNGGANLWQPTITMAGDASLGANTTAGGDKLTVNSLNDGNATSFKMTKVGPGTVEYASNTANAYEGLTQVNLGTLLLNKAGGAAPFGGNLQIGDSLPTPIAADSAIVQTATNDQVPDSAVTTINGDGLLDLNGHTETINNLTITDGHVQTGSSGTLTINNSLDMTGGEIELGLVGDRLFFGNGATITAKSSATETAVIDGAGGGDVALGAVDRTFVVNHVAGNVASDLRVTSPIIGPGRKLTKDGPGLMEIDSALNNYGTTDVHAGTLQVDGVIGAVTLSGGTLGGVGTTGAVTSNAGGGAINPGDSPGTLHTGAVTLNSSTTFFVEIDRLGAFPTPLVPGTDYDTLQVTGDLHLNGAHLSGLVDNVVGSAGIILGDTFTILTWTGNWDLGKFAEGDVVFLQNRKFTITYDNINKQIVLTKVKANVTVDIISSPVTNPLNTVVYGQPTTFLIKVTSEAGLPANAVPTNATVTITFTTVDQNGVVHDGVGSNPLPYSSTQQLSNGQYLFDPNALFGAIMGVGVHTVKADFQDPTNNFNDVDDPPAAGSQPSKTLTETVNRGASSISLTSSSQTAVYGAPITVTAHLAILSPAGQIAGTNILTGTVDFGLHRPDLPGNPTQHIIAPVGSNGTEFIASFKLPDDLPGGPAFLPVSSYVIDASYSGDTHYQGVATSTGLVQQIVKANTQVGVVGSPNPADPGQLVSFTVTVTANAPSGAVPTGTVTIKDGNTTFNSHVLDSNGQWTFQISTLAFGSHTINVTYGGDTNLNGNTGSTTEVIRGSTKTTLTSSLNPSTFGQNVTFTATVSALSPATGVPGGTVDFFDGANLIGDDIALNGSGVASLPTNLLTAGNHQISAVYNGATLYGTSSAVLSATTPGQQTVNKAPTSTVLSSTPASTTTVFGQQVTFTAQVNILAPGSGTISGTVDFLDGATVIGDDIPIVSGFATFQTTTLSAGSHTNLTAHYNGTGNPAADNFATSNSNTLSRTVNKASTTTALASTGSPSVYGQAAITATVAPVAPGGGTPTGSVTFTITNLSNNSVTTQSVNLVNGVATLNPLSPGSYTISAAYVPSTSPQNYNPSSSNGSITQVISKAQTDLSLLTSNNNAVYGEAIITASVTAHAPGAGTPTGTVAFHVKNNNTNVTTDSTAGVNGSGVATLPTLDVGSYTITATYNGDTNFLISNGGPISQTVIKANTSVDIGSNHTPSVYGQQVTFTITVSAQGPGSGTPNGTVDIFVDGSLVADDAPLVGGQAQYSTSSLTVANSPHPVTATYNGSGNFNVGNGSLLNGQTVNPGQTDSSVNSSANPAALNTTITLTAAVAARSPAAGIPTGTVDFYIDGSNSGSSGIGLDNTGHATYQVNATLLGQGQHTVVVHYNSDANFAGGDSPTFFQYIKGDTTTTVSSTNYGSVFGESIDLTATVQGNVPAIGNPSGTVTFEDVTDALHHVGLGTRTLANVGGSMQATLSISTLEVGTHAIQATYNSDDSFFGGSGTLNPDQTVNKANTSTGVSQNKVTTVYGEQAIFTALISVTNPGNASPGGTANFVIDSTTTYTRTVSAGVATLSLTDLGVGTHTVHVDYLGDGHLNGSGGDLATNHTVNKADTKVSVTSSANPATEKQTVTFNVTVNPIAPGAGAIGGSVDLFVDGILYGDDVAVTNGHASFPTSTIPVGNSHVVQVHYNGDDPNFNASDGTMAQAQVITKNPVVYTVVPGSVKSGTAFSVVVQYRNTATNQPDQSFSGNVTLALNSGPSGEKLTRTGPNGEVLSLTVKAVKGVATFSGLKLNKAGFVTLKATVAGQPALVSPTIKVTASALVAAMSPGAPTVGQSFNINVTAVDSTGGIDPNYNGALTLTVTTKPVGATVSGPKTATFSGGFASLAGIKVDKAGTYVFKLTGPNGLTITITKSFSGRKV